MMSWISPIIIGHVIMGSAPLIGFGLMLPLNILTGIWPAGESGAIRRYDKQLWPITPFESIVGSSGSWPWGLGGLLIPHPLIYFANLTIYGRALCAYPLVLHHFLVDKRTHENSEE